MTAELPSALRPWSRQLAVFPPDVAATIGPWVQRLALAVGPLRVESAAGTGEPEGYAGLTRRGSYERLLVSEWLLADEMPEEFSRRAAMREHAFYHLARREPAGSRRSLVLFDAGPEQLGAPRLAHLALLVVLARRAEAAGAELSFAVLQRRDDAAHSAISPASVLHMITGRSPRVAGDGDLQYWLESGVLPPKPEDMWIVGAVRARGLAQASGASWIQVDEPAEPDARQVMVTVARRGNAPARVALDLPDDGVCARLIRDPLSTALAAPLVDGHKTSPRTNLVFSENGKRLFVRLEAGGVAAWPIPNSPRAGRGLPKRVPGFKVIAGVGYVKRRFVVVAPYGERLLLYGVPPADGRPTSGRPLECSTGHFDFKFPEPDAPLRPCFQMEDESGAIWGLLITDGAGGLFRVVRHPEVRIADQLDHDVLAMMQWQRTVHYVTARDFGRIALKKIDRGKITEVAELELDGFGLDAVHLGYDGSPMVARRVAGGVWRTRVNQDDDQITAPTGARVVGVVERVALRQHPSLVVLEADGRTLSVAGRDGVSAMPIASAPIASAAVSHARPDVAYVTTAGELVVYSLAYNSVLMRVVPGEKP